MNKKSKKTLHKEKEKVINNQREKIKNNQEKHENIPPKPQKIQINIPKSNTESKKYKRNNKVHYSISSKEDTKKKLSPMSIRNKNNKQYFIPSYTYNNNNKFLSSNLFLTNDTAHSKDNEKPIKKNKNIKNYSNCEKLDLHELNYDFKKNMLKKTIIIDNEGNNNLNLNLQKGEKDYKKILNKKNEDNDSCLSNSFNGNTESNSLFENSTKSYVENIDNNNKENKNKENEINQNIIDQSEEEKRLKEYNKIFNLLNSNIEQFKKMFNNNKNTNNNLNNNNINSNNVINYNKNKKIIIKDKKGLKGKVIGNINHSNQKTNIKCKNRKMPKNLKKNLSDKNLSSSNKFNRNNQNKFDFNLKNENVSNNYNSEISSEINNNYSFLESSIQDDFYQSLINQTFLQNISHLSFELNPDDISNENNNENINNNRISLTECNKCKKDDVKKIDVNQKEKYKINKDKYKNLGIPKVRAKKSIENINKKDNEEGNDNNYKTYSNDIYKNNCIIF